jgi:hypothetical protein
MFASMENLDTEVEIKSAWEMIRGDKKFQAEETPGFYELKKYKLWLEEGCSKEKAKFQQLEDPTEKIEIIGRM